MTSRLAPKGAFLFEETISYASGSIQLDYSIEAD